MRVRQPNKVWFAFNWLCVIFKFTHFNFCREGNYRNAFNNCCVQYFASVCQPNTSVLYAVRIRFHWPDCFNSIVFFFSHCSPYLSANVISKTWTHFVAFCIKQRFFSLLIAHRMCERVCGFFLLSVASSNML